MGASDRARGGVLAGVALLMVTLLAGCGPTFTMQAPSAFRQFEDRGGFRLITADGVRVMARAVENTPQADLPYWIDAMKRHLDRRGYAVQAEGCFTTAAGREGCTVDFLLPNGAEDWVMSQTVFVDGELLILVEATGPFDRFQRVALAYKKALESFAWQ